MLSNIGWYFPVENNPSDRYVDEFADSKFSTDRWVSFTREIIQNSLDVGDDSLFPRQPVLVKMEYKCLPKDSIPGCAYLEKCIKKAMDGAIENHSNKHTIERYRKGLDILSNEAICCFKVSDYKTIGVNDGRDNEWGALVFDEGKSLKNRPGSAGSHGVGKKAPFIISAVNTVYYSTFNKSGKRLFQGKTSLINWNDENDKTRNGKGWFGVVDEENSDRRNRVSPLFEDNFSSVDPFFLRTDELGTDVIILGVCVDDLDLIKSRIINSVLENFFVAIKNKNLEVDIFGENIREDNLDEYVQKYYLTQKKNFSSVEGIENNVFGNLLNYYRAFAEEPISFDVEYNNKRYGRCSIYFTLENDKNKKYYCIFRNHGMKIRDVGLTNAEQPFSAVVFIDDCPEDEMDPKDRLNSRLSDVENAAHDNFIVDDEEFECDRITKALVKTIYEKVKAIILDKTRIEATDETPLEGLDEMLSIQGVLTTKLTNKKVKVKKRKNKIKKKSMGKKADDYEEGVSSVGGKNHKNHKKEGENKPAKEGDEVRATLYKKFCSEPLFIRTLDGYKLILRPAEAAVADLRILSISVEGTINSIPGLLVNAVCDGKTLQIKGDRIKDVVFEANKEIVVDIKIVRNYEYSLECDAFVGGRNDD